MNQMILTLPIRLIAPAGWSLLDKQDLVNILQALMTTADSKGELTAYLRVAVATGLEVRRG